MSDSPSPSSKTKKRIRKKSTQVTTSPSKTTGKIYYFVSVLDSQLEEWRPQIERCLWDADCGAEVAKFPSGHPVWRIPAENVDRLPETGQRVTGDGSGHGIPIISTWLRGKTIVAECALYDGVHELSLPKEHYWTDMAVNWKPITEPKQPAQKRKRGKKA